MSQGWKMRCLNFLIIFFLLFSFCSKKNPEILRSYHPEKWYRIHDDKIRNMGGNYQPCLRCHAMEGESPFEGAPACRNCHTSEP